VEVQGEGLGTAGCYVVDYVGALSLVTHFHQVCEGDHAVGLG